jgi:predicted dehydrogenase
MNVLIAGLGSIATRHIAAIRQADPDARIYALRSGHSGSSVEGVTDLHGIDEAAAIGFDFAVVSNPTSAHAHTVERLLPLRVPMLIEKPVFDSPRQSHLAHRLREAGVLSCVACNLRFLDSIGFLRNHIADNPTHRVNEVNVYCGSYLPQWRKGVADWRDIYSARADLGGGVNLDLIHDIDYVCYIFGLPAASRGIVRSASSLAIDAPDYANFTLIYPGFCASVVLNYYRRDYRRRCEIVFDDTTWTLDIAANTITDASGNIIYKGVHTVADTYALQMKYFINLVNSHARHCPNDAAAACDILRICTDYERFD